MNISARVHRDNHLLSLLDLTPLHEEDQVESNRNTGWILLLSNFATRRAPLLLHIFPMFLYACFISARSGPGSTSNSRSIRYGSKKTDDGDERHVRKFSEIFMNLEGGA
jgi:hypothetical protein